MLSGTDSCLLRIRVSMRKLTVRLKSNEFMRKRSRLFQSWLALGLWGWMCIGALQATLPAGSYWIDDEGKKHDFAQSYNCSNITDGGRIGNDTRGCANPTFQPPTIFNLSLPTGGTGVIEYMWMRTNSDPTTGGAVSWQAITTATQPEYTPPPVTASTWYMRCSRRQGCEQWAGETNWVAVIIDCCDNVTAGGTIAGNQRNCGIPYDPTLLSNVAPATGGSNTLQYTWYSSTTDSVYAPGNPAWTVASSATTPFMNPGPISQTTWYVRVAQRALCPAPGAWSNVVAVRAFANPSIKADVINVSCNGANDGEIAVTILNAQAPFTYRWVDNGSTATTRTGLAPGTYVFEIRDGNGCLVTETVEVTEPDPFTVTLEQSLDLCNFNNDAVVNAIVAGGTAPYTFNWNTGATTSSINGLAAGTYSVTVTDSNGCTALANTQVNPPANLTSSVNVTQPTCGLSNGSIVVTPSGGTAPYSYSWVPALSTSSTLSSLPGGTYTYTVTDANGCTSSQAVSLNIIAPLVVQLVADPVTCNGAADGNIFSTVSGGQAPYTYSWSNGSSVPNLSSLAPGDYELTVTDANGCDQVASITVTEPLALTASIDVIQPLCREDGGTLTANIQGGTQPYTFDWGAVGQTNVQTLLSQGPGSYTLNVIDDAGCTATATVNVDDVPLLTLATSANDASCPSENDGDATVVISGGVPGYSIQWSDDNAQTTPTASNLIPGTYTVVVTDTRGCVKSENVLVDMLSTGPIIEADLDSVVCNGAADAAIRLNITGGVGPYSFQWTDGPTVEDRSNLAAGTYEVEVTDAAGCSATQSWTFNEPQAMECTVSPTTNFNNYFHVSRFGASDGAAQVNVQGGTAPYNYTWSNGASGSTVGGLSGGLIGVTITDANGCTCAHDTTLVEPSMISDFVWQDLNGDGIQNAGEPGLNNVRVRLTGRDFNNVNVNFTVFSNSQGQYRFDQLPIGRYTLFFTLPAGQTYLFSPANQGGDDALDSDMDPVLGLVRDTVFAHGVGKTSVDAGFIPITSVVTIGDKVWYDSDHDGIQDVFEVGVQGVTMRLYRTADDFLVSTAVTNENGNYIFQNVVPGNYYIVADQSTSSIGSGFVVSTANAGFNDEADSDFDETTRRSANISVVLGGPNITNVDLGLHENCGTVTNAGQIAGDETVCIGDIPAPITSVAPASGTVRYQWIRSSTPTYRGANDPNWSIIIGATGASYQPSTLPTTVYYIRLAADASCLADFTGASNVIMKQAIPVPTVQFASISSSGGGVISGRQITMCLSETLTVTADSTSPAVFEWDFGPDATPQFATGRVVTGVSYSAVNARFAYLRVTNSQGCVGIDSFQVNTTTCFGPGDLGGASARTAGGKTTIEWSAISMYQGAWFDIERSVDGEPFELIESISNKGLRSWLEYSYDDLFAPSGQVEYRIVHQAPSVDSRFSNEVRVQVEQEALRTRVYPNPAYNSLTFELVSAHREVLSYSLYNSTGAVVRQGQSSAGRQEIDLSDLPSGIYQLRTYNSKGDTDLQTVVKQ